MPSGKRAGAVRRERLARFEKRVGKTLLAHFKKGTLEPLFAVIKAHSKHFGAGMFYRVAIVSKVYRHRRGGAALECANLIGQLALSPNDAGPHDLSFGVFALPPRSPCRVCAGEGLAGKSIGKPNPDRPGFINGMEKRLSPALWGVLEEGGLWKAIRDQRSAGKTPPAGTDTAYQVDFRSEFIRSRKGEIPAVKHLTVLGRISFPVRPSKARKDPPALEPPPGMRPAKPCPACGGSGLDTK